jgi:hypothetical protein
MITCRSGERRYRFRFPYPADDGVPGSADARIGYPGGQAWRLTTVDTSEPLVTAVARLWPDLRGLVTTDWDAFESGVLDLLRALDTAT